jgi:hypothetical protein
MASIVYEGVAGGGDLFKGQKFFLTQRVPMRQRFIDDIKVKMSCSKMGAITNCCKAQRGLRRSVRR